MDLTHKFTVPTQVDETWAHFNDIASVAECFPGATVTSVEGDTFKGSCKVKLGPIALVYNGTGTFVEKDEAGHRFLVEAKGKDKRGNGTAGANVTVSMADAAGATDVEVVTDLSVTGKPAQFGRGVMQDVSDKLLGQFVACLETRLAGTGTEPKRWVRPRRCRTHHGFYGPATSADAPARGGRAGGVGGASTYARGPSEGRRDRPRRHRAAGAGEDLLEAGSRGPRRGAGHLVGDSRLSRSMPCATHRVSRASECCVRRR